MKNILFFPLCQHAIKQLCSYIVITVLAIVPSPLQANAFFLGGIHETEVLNEITQQTVKVTGRVVDSTGEPLSVLQFLIQFSPKGFQFQILYLNTY